MVVVIDDYHDTATFMVRLLQRSGLAACCYTSAQEFLAVLAAGGPLPSLLILDIRMPGMDGPGLLRELMRDDRWREIPVVLYTADPSSDDVREAMQLGAKGSILGTMDWEHLLATIRRLRRPSTGTAAPAIDDSSPNEP